MASTKILDFILGSTGMVFNHAGYTAPPGFLLCYGQAVSRTTYAALFAAITVPLTGTTNSTNSISAASVDITALGLIGAKVEGLGIQANTTITAATAATLTLSLPATASASGVSLTIIPWGNGDGSTTFNVPDLRGRVEAGKDDMGGVARAARLAGTAAATLGGSMGLQNKSLSVAEMPSHGHTVSDPGHAHSIADPGHSHGHNAAALVQSSTGGGAFAINAYAAATINAAGTGIGIYGAATGISVAANGSGTAFDITQPTVVLNKIIKI